MDYYLNIKSKFISFKILVINNKQNMVITAKFDLYLFVYHKSNQHPFIHVIYDSRFDLRNAMAGNEIINNNMYSSHDRYKAVAHEAELCGVCQKTHKDRNRRRVIAWDDDASVLYFLEHRKIQCFISQKDNPGMHFCDMDELNYVKCLWYPEPKRCNCDFNKCLFEDLSGFVSPRSDYQFILELYINMLYNCIPPITFISVLSSHSCDLRVFYPLMIKVV